MPEYDNYHKYHRTTMSYAEAEKYIKVGWKLESINRVLLKGINKEIEQCSLVWENEHEPVIPSDQP
ncbi:MAG: hypothetical protein MR278_06965 [Bacteroidales bacterium]|nr:hypothetical protein [Anaerotignum sp.]MCI5679698.1 hypothetical protein [Bacteroidales bacterium]MDY3925717.1 hypothetical protein [Anaerotignum sp.]